MTYEELKAAMAKSIKDKNRVRKNVIADMVTCALNIAIEQGHKDIVTEENVTAAILKSKKVCQEQIDTCPAQRPDRLEAYKLCMTYIDELAPKMMDEDEIRIKVTQIISDENIEMSKGAIMKAVMPKLKGLADGKTINKIVTEIIKK